MDLGQLFYAPRLNILSKIAEGGFHAAMAARETRTSYAHVSHIVHLFEEMGLVNRFENFGHKTVPLELTNRGKIVWENLKKVKELIENEDSRDF